MKLVLSTIGIAVLLASPVAAQEDVSSASKNWVTSAFKSLCFEPFGDKAEVEKAVAAFAEMTEFRKIEPDPGAPQMGVVWESPKASLSYTDAEWLPRDLPSPQCSLQFETPEFDHLGAAQAFEANMPIGAGKQRGKNERLSTQWDFKGANDAKRRLFLSSEPGGPGKVVKVSLLNLRK